MPYAYPTSEHYTPLFVAIGAGNDTAPSRPPSTATLEPGPSGRILREYETDHNQHRPHRSLNAGHSH